MATNFRKASFLERLFAGHHDVVAALRSLRRSPGFVAIAVLSLGLAIGLNTTTFAMLDAVKNPYLPFTGPSELLTVQPVGWARRDRAAVARDMYLEMRDRKDLMQAVVPWTSEYTTPEANGHLISTNATTVGADFFRVLGVKPVLGRTFDARTEGAVAGAPVVISDRVWQQFFGEPHDLHGVVLTINGQTHPVVGVMPASMDYPNNTNVWLPMAPSVEQSAQFPAGRLSAVARIRTGDNVGRVRTELSALATRIATDLGEDHKLFDYNTKPLVVTAPRANRLAQSLSGASLLLLVVVCLNLANLMLTRGIGRRRELAVRKAVGASGAALIRFVLTEAAVLAIGGGSWGVMLSLWGVNVAKYRMPVRLQQLGFLAPHVSWRVVSAGVLITAVTVFVAGLAPALQARRTDPGEAMKDGGANTAKRNRVFPALAIGQVGLALVVMMGAGLLLRAAHEYGSRTFSGDARHVLVSEVIPDSAACLAASGGSYMHDLAENARDVPGVGASAVGVGVIPPHSVVTSDLPGKLRQIGVQGYDQATPDFLKTLGIGIAKGRDFQPGDLGSPGVVIVNQETAGRLWGRVPPVGRMIKLGYKNADLPWLPVIGVTAASPDTVNGVVFDAAPDITVVGGQRCGRLVFYARTINDDPQTPIAVFHALRAAVPVGYVGPVRSSIGSYTEDRRVVGFLAFLFSALGVFGLALAAFGVYGVLSYVVSRRMREFAMRVALGAQGGDLSRIVLHDAAVIVLAGTGVGAWAAMWGGHFLSRAYYLYNVDYTDVFALAGAEAILMAITLAACTGPVRRAADADPVELLRAT